MDEPVESEADEPRLVSRFIGDVLVLEGELDYLTVEDAVSAALQHFRPSQPITIDASGLRFIDSSGATALLRLRRHAGDTREAVTLLHPAPFLRSKLRLIGLIPYFTLED